MDTRTIDSADARRIYLNAKQAIEMTEGLVSKGVLIHFLKLLCESYEAHGEMMVCEAENYNLIIQTIKKDIESQRKRQEKEICNMRKAWYGSTD